MYFSQNKKRKQLVFKNIKKEFITITDTSITDDTFFADQSPMLA